MKRNNFFKSTGTFLMAGVFAFSFAACGDGSERSTYEGSEEIVEEEQTEMNDATVGYENGEYNIDQEYAYEDRELVRNRLREDIDRADRSLERIGTQMEQTGKNVTADTRREWEETERKLREERERLNMRLQEVENSTKENWEKVRNDVNTTLRDWEREWEKLENKDLDVDVNVRDEQNQ